MYWSASTLICSSMSTSLSEEDICTILVMTEDPATATATFLVPVPARWKAFFTASATSSGWLICLSVTASTGSGSTA